MSEVTFGATNHLPLCSWCSMHKDGGWRGAWVLLLPGCKLSLGAAWMVSEDGKWTKNGKVLRGFHSSDDFVSLVLGRYMLKLRAMGGEVV